MTHNVRTNHTVPFAAYKQLVSIRGKQHGATTTFSYEKWGIVVCAVMCSLRPFVFTIQSTQDVERKSVFSCEIICVCGLVAYSRTYQTHDADWDA